MISFGCRENGLDSVAPPGSRPLAAAGSSVGAHWLPLTPEHGFPSLSYPRHEALPSCPPGSHRDRRSHLLPNETETTNRGHPIGWPLQKIRICPGLPTLALPKSGHRSKVAPSSQPVLQAPVCSVVADIIHPRIVFCKPFPRSFPGKPPGRASPCAQPLISQTNAAVSCRSMSSGSISGTLRFPAAIMGMAASATS